MTTWVLIAVFTWSTSIAVPFYDSKETCEAARAALGPVIGKPPYEVSANVISVCIPGPSKTVKAP